MALQGALELRRGRVLVDTAGDRAVGVQKAREERLDLLPLSPLLVELRIVQAHARDLGAPVHQHLRPPPGLPGGNRILVFPFRAGAIRRAVGLRVLGGQRGAHPRP